MKMTKRSGCIKGVEPEGKKEKTLKKSPQTFAMP